MKLGLKEALEQHRRVRGNNDTPWKMYVRYCNWNAKISTFLFWLLIGLTGLGLIIQSINPPSTNDQRIQIKK